MVEESIIINLLVNKKLGTITSANLAVGTSLKSSKNNKEKYESDKGSKEELEMINANSDMYIDFNIPWTIGVDYKVDYRRNINSNIDTSYLHKVLALEAI